MIKSSGFRNFKINGRIQRGGRGSAFPIGWQGPLVIFGPMGNLSFIGRYHAIVRRPGFVSEDFQVERYRQNRDLGRGSRKRWF